MSGQDGNATMFDIKAYRHEMAAKGKSNLIHGDSTREWTAKTVNEELHSLQASCERIAERLASKPGCPKLTDLLARQKATLDKAIAAALEGRVYRHRGEVAGERLEQFSARKAKIRAKRIAASYPSRSKA